MRFTSLSDKIIIPIVEIKPMQAEKLTTEHNRNRFPVKQSAQLQVHWYIHIKVKTVIIMWLHILITSKYLSTINSFKITVIIVQVHNHDVLLCCVAENSHFFQANLLFSFFAGSRNSNKNNKSIWTHDVMRNNDKKYTSNLSLPTFRCACNSKIFILG